MQRLTASPVTFYGVALVGDGSVVLENKKIEWDWVRVSRKNASRTVMLRYLTCGTLMMYHTWGGRNIEKKNKKDHYRARSKYWYLQDRLQTFFFLFLSWSLQERNCFEIILETCINQKYLRRWQKLKLPRVSDKNHPCQNIPFYYLGK